MVITNLEYLVSGALITELNLDSHLNGIVYEGVAPSEQTYPYIVFFQRNKVKQMWSTVQYREYEIQFNIYSNQPNPKQVEEYMEYLTNRLDFKVLTVSGYNPTAFKRTESRPIPVKDKNTNTNRYQGVVIYKFYI